MKFTKEESARLEPGTRILITATPSPDRFPWFEPGDRATLWRLDPRDPASGDWQATVEGKTARDYYWIEPALVEWEVI